MVQLRLTKTFFHLLVKVAICLLPIACATAPPAPPVHSLGPPSVTVEDTEFDSYRTYKTNPIRTTVDRGKYVTRDTIQVTLSGIRHKKTGDVHVLVNALIEYQGAWRFYSGASLLGGRILPIKHIRRNIGSCRGGCDLDESMVFDIPLDVVKQNIQTGLRMRLNADAGPAVEIEVPASYLIALIQAVTRNQ